MGKGSLVHALMILAPKVLQKTLAMSLMSWPMSFKIDMNWKARHISGLISQQIWTQVLLTNSTAPE